MTALNESAAVHLRAAVSKDVPALDARARRVVDYGSFDWARRVEGAQGRYAVFVAVEESGRTVGQVALGPVEIRLDRVIYDRRRSPAAAKPPPWCKLDLIAVDPVYQGKGIGRRLLQQAVQWMPAAMVGLYGNVDQDNSAAVSWYRRQGFSIAAASALPFDLRFRSAGGALMVPPDGELMFRGVRQTVQEHLAGNGRPGWEEREARANFQLDVRTRGRTARGDTGYRRLAQRAAEQSAAGPGCPHMSLGPRPAWIFAWDPKLQRSCNHCISDRLDAIKPYDDETLCDGCHEHHADVVLSWATADHEMLIVDSGLCSSCRAGRF